MLSRWVIYLREIYQPASRVAFSGLMAFLTWMLVTAAPRPDFPWGSFLVATITYALMILYYRVSDEFKDEDTDRRFFPNRPVPSGRVSLEDLRWLRHTTSVLAFLLQIFTPHAFPMFVAFWIFSWLMGRWFFLPKLIGENRLLAFITHAPVGFFGGLYLLAVFQSPDERLISNWSLMLMCCLNLPGLVWELLRKTRSPQAEVEGYQTYSAMLGTGGALSLSAMVIIASMVVLVWMMPTLGLPSWSISALAAIHVLLLAFLPWLHWQMKKKVIELKPLGESYNGLVIIILVIGAWLRSP